MNKRPQSVDEYIASAPNDTQNKLLELRSIIKITVPDVQERISYSMPYYDYKGRLAYFAFAKTHIGLYIPPPVIAEHKTELRDYKTATATIRFPLNKKLPTKLIQKLIKARMKKNEEKKS